MHDARLWQTHRLKQTHLVRGEGCTVWDEDGQAYLDLLAGTWCNVLGYAHPRWVAALREQLGGLTHVGAAFASAEVDGALEKLAEILPPELDRVVLLNTGSEAVELALKMARAATGIDAVAVMRRGYYGATAYALALSEAGLSAPYLPHPGSVHRIPAPDCRRCPVGGYADCGRCVCLDALRANLAGRSTRLAAMLYEPVMGSGGVIVPPAGYAVQLRALADQCGGLLIAEEVTTGLGRTGRWFGFEHENVHPDILVIGKALGAGLPVAAVVTTAAVEARCQQRLRHVQSHQNDPFSGRIAATVISILQAEHLVEQAAQRGTYLLESLTALQAKHPEIWEVRGQGLMVGIEFDQGRSAQAAGVVERLFADGFILDCLPDAGILRLFPPYVISVEEIDRFVTALDRALTR